jgi:hypothetical protein
MPDQSLNQDEVLPGALRRPEDGVVHDAGGVVHRQQQDEPGVSFLQPGVMATIQLHQHPNLGHSLAAEAVLRRTPCIQMVTPSPSPTIMVPISPSMLALRTLPIPPSGAAAFPAGRTARKQLVLCRT